MSITTMTQQRVRQHLLDYGWIDKPTALLINFNAHFRPDLMKQKAWWLDWLKQEVQE